MSSCFSPYKTIHSCVSDKSPTVELSQIKYWIGPKFLLAKELKTMSFIGVNKPVYKFIRLRLDKLLECNTIRMCYDFIHPEMLHFCILLSQVGLCLMRIFSPPPTHPSFIFLYPPPSPTPSSVPDEPGQLKIYLPKKLLECLPKCSSLPKERHRWNTNEVRMSDARSRGKYPRQRGKLFAGDSSFANVTLRDEEEANKHNGSFSLWGLKTVTPKK